MNLEVDRTSQLLVAISLIALVSLAIACGSETSPTVAVGSEPTAEAEHPPASPTVEPLVPGTVRSTDDSWEAVGVLADDDVEQNNEDSSAGLFENSWDWEDEEALDHESSNESSSAGTTPPDDSSSVSDAEQPPAETVAPTPAGAMTDPTEPPLINTPSPVANLAPDFTLPSVQGPEYSLSQFRGEQPVAVVFYRAYW